LTWRANGAPHDPARAEHGFVSFQEDAPGLDLAREHGLVDNFLWANDCPHHEGTWPHSPAAIERTMSKLDDGERAKILGLNAAKLLGFDPSVWRSVRAERQARVRGPPPGVDGGARPDGAHVMTRSSPK